MNNDLIINQNLPIKKTLHFDTSKWHDFTLRENDIIVVTYGKSGTTWLQNILLQLIYNGNIPIDEYGPTIHHMSPWVDHSNFDESNIEDINEKLKTMTNRRILKTHGGSRYIPYHKSLKYIYITRNGLDAGISYFNHQHAYTDEFLEKHKIDVCSDIEEFWKKKFLIKLNNDRIICPYLLHLKGWWNKKIKLNASNILFLRFEDLKLDLVHEMCKIADFINILQHNTSINNNSNNNNVQIDNNQSNLLSKNDIILISKKCTFSYMKTNEHLYEQNSFQKGKFINKGITGRGRSLLSENIINEYLDYRNQFLPSDCIEFLTSPFKPNLNYIITNNNSKL